MAITFSFDLTAIKMNQRVYKLEQQLLEMPQSDIKTDHIFLPGIYERRITIPAWTTLTGAVHRTNYKVRLERGTIAVNTEDGIKILTAPCEFSALAGLKRAGRVFGEEVVWVDIYENPDDCQDLDILVERLYTIKNCDMGDVRPSGVKPSIPNYSQKRIYITQAPLRIARDKSDYDLFVRQLGTTKKQISDIATNTSDLIPMPEGYDVEVKASPLHGKGLFVTREFKTGEYICPGRINSQRTPAGRYINHSSAPNAETAIDENGDLSAIALHHIYRGEEILIDYRNSMKINFGITIPGESICQVG